MILVPLPLQKSEGAVRVTAWQAEVLLDMTPDSPAPSFLCEDSGKAVEMEHGKRWYVHSGQKDWAGSHGFHEVNIDISREAEKPNYLEEVRFISE